MDKIPVYYVPGIGAKCLIYERIKLPESKFKCTYLEWELPLDGETLADYSKRLCRHIKEENPVLIGVSFGGLIVQEMAKFVNARKVIIISSAKCNKEYPRRFRIARKTGIYKLVPTKVLINLGRLARFPISPKIDERLKLYKRYLGMKDRKYWNWAIEQLILWERDTPDPSVIHIHGDDDEIFPSKYIGDYIKVPGGTHIMLVKRYKWFNENLEKIILGPQSA